MLKTVFPRQANKKHMPGKLSLHGSMSSSLRTDKARNDITLLQNQIIWSSRSCNPTRDKLHFGVNYSNKSVGLTCFEAILTLSLLEENLMATISSHLEAAPRESLRFLSRADPLCNIVIIGTLSYSRK